MDPPIPKLRTEDERIAALRAYLKQRQDLPPDEIQIIRAPLRICPLGAHIDHQHGIVTGMTIDQSVLFAFAPTQDGSIHVESTGFKNQIKFDLNAVPPYQEGDWGNYLRGAVIALKNESASGSITTNINTGIIGVIDSSMPVGGLSSSAAVTVAYLLALQTVNNLTISPHENIALVSHAEQQYIGLNNGILDQTSILFSQPNNLTRIDCQNRDISLVPSTSKTPYDILIVYSGMTKSSLVATGYNNRVAECREAASLLLHYSSPEKFRTTSQGAEMGQNFSGQEYTDQETTTARLRDVDPKIFAHHQSKLPDPLRKRATHYFGEMDRVHALRNIARHRRRLRHAL